MNTNKQRTAARAAMTLLSAAALVACGGGGGSDSGTATATTLALSGTVAKGPATGAKVKVFATNADGSQGALLAEATTVAGGGYTVNIPAQTNPVLVVADLEGATIVDETSTATPQATYVGVAGNTLRAVLLASSGSAAAANVTPFSDVAADLAVEAGGYKAANVEGANSKVRTWLGGVDHLSASVTDPTTLLPRLRAVQTLVNDSSLTAVLTAFKDASTYSAAAGGYVINGAFSQTLKDACTGTCGTFADATVAQTPVPPTGTVEPVKAFIQDLRNTLLAYGQKSGELATAGAGLSSAFDIATTTVGSEQIGMLALFPDALRLLDQYRASPSDALFQLYGGSRYGRVYTTETNGTPTPESWLREYGCQITKVATTTTAAGQLDYTTYASTGLADGSANAVACYGIATQGRLVSTSLGDGFAYYERLLFLPQTDGTYRYVSDVRKLPFARTSAASVRSGAPRFGTISAFRNDLGEVTAFSMQGQLVPGLQVASPRTVAAYNALQKVDVSLAFYVSEVGTLRTLGLNGSLKLSKVDGTEASSVVLAPGSVVTVATGLPRTSTYYQYGGETCPSGSTVAEWSPSAPDLYCLISETTYDRIAAHEVSLDVTVAVPGAKLQGIIGASDAGYDKSRTVYYPTKTSFQGKVYESDGAGGYRLLLDGKFTAQLESYAGYDQTVEQSSSNFAPLVGGFEGKILVKNRPEMSLVLTLNKASLTSQTLSGTFGWNGKSLTLLAVNDEASSENSFARLSNSDGLQVTFPKGGVNTSQDLYKSGFKVGTVNLNTQRIDYTDGTFEQF